MRKLARRFLDWLDRRFPERVTVTEKSYEDLKAKVEAIYGIMTPQRLQQIENEINKFNVALGFGTPILKANLRAFER